MNKTTVRLSEFTQTRLKRIAQDRGVSVSQLLNEIALQYIGAIDGVEMMRQRASRGSKRKALAALAKVRKAGRPTLPEDSLTGGG